MLLDDIRLYIGLIILRIENRNVVLLVFWFASWSSHFYGDCPIPERFGGQHAYAKRLAIEQLESIVIWPRMPAGIVAAAHISRY